MAFLKEQAFDYLCRAQSSQRLAHAYLVRGTRGSGKLELAAAICDLVSRNPTSRGVDRQDVTMIEPESKSRRITIEQIRELEGHLQMRAAEDGMKVGIIIDADRMQPAAANAFLKTLEEPPANSILLLITALPEALLDTIVSRCIEIPLKESTRQPLTQPETKLCDLLELFFKRSHYTAGNALNLAADILQLLAEMKADISEQSEDSRKAEDAQYGKTTDSTKWLKDREVHYKALTESTYIRERSRLLDILSLWLADTLRHQVGGHLDLPERSQATAELAATTSEKCILGALAALSDLRRMLDRNVAEALCIESGLIEAIGKLRACT